VNPAQVATGVVFSRQPGSKACSGCRLDAGS